MLRVAVAKKIDKVDEDGTSGKLKSDGALGCEAETNDLNEVCEGTNGDQEEVSKMSALSEMASIKARDSSAVSFSPFIFMTSVLVFVLSFQSTTIRA